MHWLFTKLEKAAKLNDYKYINIYTKIAHHWASLAKDGIHSEEEGQILMSKMIDAQLKRPWLVLSLIKHKNDYPDSYRSLGDLFGK